MQKIFPVTILLLISVGELAAQRSYWVSEFKTDLFSDAVGFSVAPEMRFDGDGSRREQLCEIGLEYELPGSIDLGIGYRIGREWDSHDEAQAFDRFSVDLKYGDSLGLLGYSFRLKYTNGDDPDDDQVRQYLRYRIKLDSKRDFYGITPYLGYELYQNLDDGCHERNALFGGLEWDFAHGNEISLEYKQVEKLHSKKDYDVITIAYQFKF